MSQNPTDGPVHDWFELSYSNYQVLPRTLMQSMPIQWQERMVACLEELRAAYWHLPQAEGYEVHAATEHIVGEMTTEELARAGIEEDWYGGETAPAEMTADEFTAWQAQYETAEAAYYRDGVELDRHERILLCCPDPVPHYNRGRTYIEPRPSA